MKKHLPKCELYSQLVDGKQCKICKKKFVVIGSVHQHIGQVHQKELLELKNQKWCLSKTKIQYYTNARININPKSCPFMIYLNTILHVLHHYWFSRSNNSSLWFSQCMFWFTNCFASIVFFSQDLYWFSFMLISNSISQMNVCWNQRQYSIYNSHFGKYFFIDCFIYNS